MQDLAGEREIIANFLFECVTGKGKEVLVVLNSNGALLVLGMLLDGEEAGG